MCQNTFNFFDSLVIFGHYFTGNGKVSCILATDRFPNKKIKKTSCVVVFFSYRQNTSRQLATSSENLVASAQFLFTLATSESQFQALVKFTFDHCLFFH